jgi:hypothetical protein
MFDSLAHDQITSAAAWIAIAISLLAAYYARQAVMETRRSNAISLLDRQHALLDELEELRMYMMRSGEHADSREIGKYANVANRAYTCFPTHLSEKIGRYYDACFAMAETHRRAGGVTDASREDAKQHTQLQNELSTIVDNELHHYLKNAAGFK